MLVRQCTSDAIYMNSAWGSFGAGFPFADGNDDGVGTYAVPLEMVII